MSSDKNEMIGCSGCPCDRCATTSDGCRGEDLECMDCPLGCCGNPSCEIDDGDEIAQGRRTGRAYRRVKGEAKRSRLLGITSYCWRGNIYTEWEYQDGSFVRTGKYVKRRKNSKNKRYWKAYSNRVIRKKSFERLNGGKYKRLIDYGWRVY